MMQTLRGKMLVLTTVGVALTLGLSACGRSEDADSGKKAGEAVPERPAKKEKTTGEEASSRKDEQEKAQQEDGDEQTGQSGQDKEGESERKQEDMVKLDPELPNPMFAGTPRTFASDILDPDTGEQRGDVYVPKGMTENVARGKKVTASGDPITGELSQITDGDKSGRTGSHVSLPPGKQWVQIDLEKKHKIGAILVWHFHSHARVYHDIVVQVSNDRNFEGDVTTLYNNDHDNSLGMGAGDDYEYIETSEGRLIRADGVEARYVRLYSNGNTSNSMNHYVEVTVYGKSAE